MGSVDPISFASKLPLLDWLKRFEWASIGSSEAPSSRLSPIERNALGLEQILIELTFVSGDELMQIDLFEPDMHAYRSIRASASTFTNMKMGVEQRRNSLFAT